ncbi:phosphatase PAP2 family protein [Variovorax guangxiensis]|uniref:Phosphatase PAP2 family protein n=1 Tax=Variovorax guangxiensis TaxID=1775474 RepID=A0A502DRN8_9BURK|nr:phosphatase PAP2 family protein [Variovorax guangxiensis]TPG23449.1 phosphatase PAP2 family protein [Variovorax ginsengisoli]TPG27997.1 phosphatase PAP2 family protein [Variovorax guangxiensis]
MNALNATLFGIFGGGFNPNPAVLSVALALAVATTWACAALLFAAAWIKPEVRMRVLLVLVVAGLASLLSRELAAALAMPRPFMVGLSPPHLEHGMRAGLPSTHAAVMFTVAFMLVFDRRLRAVGMAVLAMAATTGWARVYVGVHFPLDIVAGALLGLCIAVAARAAEAGLRPLLSSVRPQYAWMTGVLSSQRFGPWLVVAFALAAMWVGLNTPSMIRPAFLQEGGPVENSTIFLYLVSALCVLTLRPPAWSKRDVAAVCIVLLAFAAREADLHIALFGISILKARFYNSIGTPWQIAGALAVLAPIVLSLLWLALRSQRVWRAALSRRRWRAPARTVMAFMLAIVLAKSLDRMPEILHDTGLLREMPTALRYVLLSLEEILELSLPVLATVALLQLRLGRYPTWLRRPRHGLLKQRLAIAR